MISVFLGDAPGGCVANGMDGWASIRVHRFRGNRNSTPPSLLLLLLSCCFCVTKLELTIDDDDDDDRRSFGYYLEWTRLRTTARGGEENCQIEVSLLQLLGIWRERRVLRELLLRTFAATMRISRSLAYGAAICASSTQLVNGITLDVTSEGRSSCPRLSHSI